MTDTARHVTVAGDFTGDYVVDEELDDGRLVIRPERPYPSVFPTRVGRALTDDELSAFMAEHGPHMLPPDDEG